MTSSLGVTGSVDAFNDLLSHLLHVVSAAFIEPHSVRTRTSDTSASAARLRAARATNASHRAAIARLASPSFIPNIVARLTTSSGALSSLALLDPPVRMTTPRRRVARPRRPRPRTLESMMQRWRKSCASPSSP